MVSQGQLSVLRRLVDGRTLYFGRNRAFMDGQIAMLNAKMLQVMFDDGLIEMGGRVGMLEVIVITPKGEDVVRSNPVVDELPPTRAWWVRIASKLEGLEDIKIQEFPVTNKCWIWTGTRNSSGNAKTTIDGDEILLHRFLYELCFGKLPKAKRIRNHYCRNRLCVNPHHWSDTVGVKERATKQRNSPEDIDDKIHRAIRVGASTLEILRAWKEVAGFVRTDLVVG